MLGCSGGVIPLYNIPPCGYFCYFNFYFVPRIIRCCGSFFQFYIAIANCRADIAIDMTVCCIDSSNISCNNEFCICFFITVQTNRSCTRTASSGIKLYGIHTACSIRIIIRFKFVRFFVAGIATLYIYSIYSLTLSRWESTLYP